jgi:hypothetical protein
LGTDLILTDPRDSVKSAAHRAPTRRWVSDSHSADPSPGRPSATVPRRERQDERTGESSVTAAPREERARPDEERWESIARPPGRDGTAEDQYESDEITSLLPLVPSAQ